MVKEERSLRTRQWPVRSGVLRGARSENFAVSDRPLPLRRLCACGPGVRKHRLFANRIADGTTRAATPCHPQGQPDADPTPFIAHHSRPPAVHAAGTPDFARNRR